MRKPITRAIGLLFAGVFIASVASADLTIVDTDNTTTDLIPTLILDGGAANPGGSLGRWGSFTNIGTEAIGVTADPATSTDVYVQWAGLAVPVSSARYIQVHYVVNGEGFIGSNHRLFPSTSTIGGGINMANDDQIYGTPGAHSFIVDMFSDPDSKDYEGGGGNWTAFRWDPWNETSLTDNAGKSITFTKIVFGNELGVVSDASYVSATPTDWADPTAWSDGLAARADVTYYATNSVVLETPATTTTFPGRALNLGAPQRMELMVSGSDVITIDALNLDGADVGAGAGSGEAKLDGQINVNGDSTFSGATDNSKDLRILAKLVAGSVAVELAAPTKTIYIDNPANEFGGTWVVESGAAEFTSPGAVGAANIQVRSNGTLRVVGDWDGTLAGGNLTVADSPNALVDLSTYDWTTGNLTIGGSNVPPYITYNATELNAFASNTVFSGSGSLYVGPPPPDTYYLQANVPAGRWIGEQEFWFDAPTGGNVMPSSQIFAGSTFDVNGWAWRSRSDTFDGALVVNDTAGSDLYSAYGATFRIEGGMTLDNVVVARPHVSPAGTYVNDLEIGPTGQFAFRALINSGVTNKIQNLSMGVLSGSGLIKFGGNQNYDSIGVWSLAVEETSPDFTGIVNLVEGQLTFLDDVFLPNAAFEMALEDNSVVLSNNVVFASLSFGSSTLSSGIYTAEELNAALSTDRFSGSGLLSFELIAPVYVAPVITSLVVDGANATISGTSSNSNANAEYRLQSASELQFAGWVSVETNTFDDVGDFSVTTPVSGGTEEFYRIQVGE